MNTLIKPTRNRYLLVNNEFYRQTDTSGGNSFGYEFTATGHGVSIKTHDQWQDGKFTLRFPGEAFPPGRPLSGHFRGNRAHGRIHQIVIGDDYAHRVEVNTSENATTPPDGTYHITLYWGNMTEKYGSYPTESIAVELAERLAELINMPSVRA